MKSTSPHLNFKQITQYNNLINSIENKIRSIHQRRKSRTNSSKSKTYISTSFGQQKFKIVKQEEEDINFYQANKRVESPEKIKKFRLPFPSNRNQNQPFKNSTPFNRNRRCGSSKELRNNEFNFNNEEKFNLFGRLENKENIKNENYDNFCGIDSKIREEVFGYLRSYLDDFKIKIVSEVGDLVNKWLVEFSRTIKDKIERKNDEKKLRSLEEKIEKIQLSFQEEILNFDLKLNKFKIDLENIEEKGKIPESKSREKSIKKEKRVKRNIQLEEILKKNQKNENLNGLERSILNVEKGLKRIEKSLERKSEKPPKTQNKRQIIQKRNLKETLNKFEKTIKRKKPKKKHSSRGTRRRSLSLVGLEIFNK